MWRGDVTCIGVRGMCRTAPWPSEAAADAAQHLEMGKNTKILSLCSVGFFDDKGSVLRTFRK